MPITLTDLQGNTRTLTVEYDGDTVTIVYRPGAITPSSSQDFSRQTTADQLLELLVSWDVLDDKGKALPVSKDLLDTLPARFLAHLVSAIVGDLRPNVRRAAS